MDKKKTAGLLCLFIISLLLFAKPHALAQCPTPQVRVYASSQNFKVTSFLNLGLNPGSVSNAALAANGVPSDFSTLDGGLLGSATQFLNFAQTYHAGTAVTVKLTLPSGLLSLLGGVTVQPIIGPAHTAVGSPVSGTTLISLLTGSGDDEITISPTGNFDGVSVSIGGINVAQSLNVYDAYIMQTATAKVDCNTPVDVLSGVKPTTTLANIGSVLGTVHNPENAIDTDTTSYAEIDAVASVLNSVYHTTIFNSPSRKGDTIKMIIQNSGAGLLDLNVSSGFSVQLYNGTTAVDTITYSTSSLSLQLFPRGSDKYELDISPPSDAVYDRVQVSVGGVAALGFTKGLKIYDVKRVIATPIINSSPTPAVTTICEGTTTTLTVSNVQDCTTYKWYDAAVGGTLLYTGSSYTLPNTLSAGTHTYYVEATRDGCTEVSIRSLATVNVNPMPTITPGTVAAICTGVNTTTLPYTNGNNSPTKYSIAWDPSSTNFVNVTDAALPSPTAGTINIDVPGASAAGTYTGRLTVKNNNLCVSADMPISVTVNPVPLAPTVNVSN